MRYAAGITQQSDRNYIQREIMKLINIVILQPLFLQTRNFMCSTA